MQSYSEKRTQYDAPPVARTPLAFDPQQRQQGGDDGAQLLAPLPRKQGESPAAHIQAWCSGDTVGGDCQRVIVKMSQACTH